MKKQNQQNKKKIPDFVWQVAAIVLACVCAVCFRPSMGIVRMLPIPFLCMLVCAFLPVKCWQRLIYFLLLSVALNAVELNDNVLLAVAAVAILIAFVCAELTAWLIRRKKTVCTVLAAALFVACPLASSLLVGNPITAWKADKQIDSYTERTYDLQEGGISKSKLSFDFYRRAYTVTMTSQSNPTETGTVGIRNDILSDGYLNVLEAWYQRKATE